MSNSKQVLEDPLMGVLEDLVDFQVLKGFKMPLNKDKEEEQQVKIHSEIFLKSLKSFSEVEGVPEGALNNNKLKEKIFR